MNNDDLQFRPMSKGLGFHQSKSSGVNLNKAALPPKKPALIQQAALLSNKNRNISANVLPPVANTSEVLLKRANSLTKLAMSTETSTNTETALPAKVSNQSFLGIRFFSWLVDVVALCLLISASSALIFQLNNFSWDEPLQFFQMDFFWNLYLPLGFGFYLFYFMLFERVTGQTLGKLIFGLKVVKLNSDQPPTLGQCFLRNFLNILSFATIGLLTVYDVVNWSLGLKVVKTNSK